MHFGRIACCKILAFAMTILLSLGCTSEDKLSTAVADKNNTNIKRVINLYTAYMQTHGQGPDDVAQIKDFTTKDMPPATLKLMTIDPAKIDALFISERDGKPFNIKPGLHWGGPDSANPAVVFEAEGRGGIRQVAFGFGTIEDVDDAKYKELWEDAQ